MNWILKNHYTVDELELRIEFYERREINKEDVLNKLTKFMNEKLEEADKGKIILKFRGLTNTSLFKFSSTFDFEIKIIHEWITDENKASVYEFKN